jgi:hypothetical protein
VDKLTLRNTYTPLEKIGEDREVIEEIITDEDKEDIEKNQKMVISS